MCVTASFYLTRFKGIPLHISEGFLLSFMEAQILGASNILKKHSIKHMEITCLWKEGEIRNL